MHHPVNGVEDQADVQSVDDGIVRQADSASCLGVGRGDLARMAAGSFQQRQHRQQLRPGGVRVGRVDLPAEAMPTTSVWTRTQKVHWLSWELKTPEYSRLGRRSRKTARA